ncbi:MAG: FAD-binding oxidoreductase, partial [Eubacteriales bacterium]|nr:FAD-binding oxidoreductase [Eubacteriales bacterium]
RLIMKELKDLILPMGEEYVDYLHDESRQEGTAQSISFPTTEEEVCEVLRRMHADGTNVTIQGNRTGLAAAAVPEDGHILNIEKMTRVLGMRIGKAGVNKDPRCRYRQDPEEEAVFVRVQPGLSLNQFREYLRAKDFPTEGWDASSLEAYRTFLKMPERYFPPDPTEGSASLGGMAACNSSGAKSFYYGSMRGYVEGVRMALSDGDVIALQRGEQSAQGRHFAIRTEGGRVIEGDLPTYNMPHCKNAAGYYAADNMDLVDLLVGSDGTFGVFTELELRLLPMPPVIYGINCFFEKKAQAVGFSAVVRRDCQHLAAIEYLDGNSLNLLRKLEGKDLGIPEASDCMLYLEIHTETQDEAMEDAGIVLLAVEEVGADPDGVWLAETYAERQRLLDMRHMVPESVNSRIGEYKRTHPEIAKTASDMAMPDKQFLKVLKMYDKDLKEGGYDFAVWGHFGDNHLHINVLPRTKAEMFRAKQMYAEWAKVITSLGGTVSAEHGTGKIKAPLLALMYGKEGIAQMAAVRRLFDPDGMLGRGNLF